MKILISAYACEPNKGSEPEVGFRVVLAAARDHEVWVLTRKNNIEPLQRALTEAGVAVGKIAPAGAHNPGAGVPS